MGPQPATAGKGELSRKGRTEGFHAVEVPVDERGPVITGYREVPVVSWARPSRSCLTPGIIRSSRSTTALRAGDPPSSKGGCPSTLGT